MSLTADQFYMLKTTIYTTFIISIAFMQVGCGKKVTNDRSPASDDVSDSRAARSETFKFQASIQSDGTSQAAYKKFAQDLEARIPESINVKAGNAGNHSAVIYFNAISMTEFDFYCKYAGGASTSSPTEAEDIQKGLKYNFQDCYKNLGDQDQINYEPGEPITQFNDSALILELNGADSRYNTSAEADLELKW
jgi:hypothetical protein